MNMILVNYWVALQIWQYIKKEKNPNKQKCKSIRVQPCHDRADIMVMKSDLFAI